MTAASGVGGQRLAGPSLDPGVEREGARAGASAGPPGEARDEAARRRALDTAWLAFRRDMQATVTATLARSLTPPEIAYAVGEIVHNHFRTGGLVLTSFELRRFVAELLRSKAETAPPEPLVTFEREGKAANGWTGDEPSAPPEPAIAEPQAALLPDTPPVAAPPASRREAPVATMVEAIVALARDKLDAAGTAPPTRGLAIEAIGLALRQQGLPVEPESPLFLTVLSELCGLGLIDRLWTDRSVEAVYVDAPASVWVERAGRFERAAESFRDSAHLAELLARIAPPGLADAAGVVPVNLRDGGEGVVVYPPAAPQGPVFMLRRGKAGGASLAGLVRAGMLDEGIVGLLRIAVAGRLKVAVEGPAGSGRTSILAALLRDGAASRRTLGIAAHREFASAAGVELVTLAGTPVASLLAAASDLRPDLAAVDLPAEGETLARWLREQQGSVVVTVAEGALREKRPVPFDLVLRLGRASDGLFRVLAVRDALGTLLMGFEQGAFRRHVAVPSFAAAVQDAGYGDALAEPGP